MDLFLILREISFRELVRLLLDAGARLRKENWFHAFSTDKTDLLQLILEHGRISQLETSTRGSSVPHHPGKSIMKQQELGELVCEALHNVHFAACWLPLLLKAGLEPSLLLQHNM